MIYLAAPYTHADPSVREQRFQTINKVAASFFAQNLQVFSPISHSHPIALVGDLPTDWEFWTRFCIKMLSVCDKFYILTLDGWEESTGVKEETKLANAFRIPIFYISP